MDILVLKLTVTPILIGVSALVGRRWGPGLGGWLVGIPFTSGPIALVLSISQGWHFAGDTAVGTLAGTASEAVFCLAYALAASSFSWRLSLTAGVAGFGGATLALFRLPLSVAPALAIAAAGVALALALSPRPASGSAQPQTGAPGGIRDIGARMVVATAVVLALTGAATLLGSTLTGLLAPFPIFGAVMMVFSQRRQGGSAGIAAARGLLWGLFGAALFFLVLATLLPRFGLIAFLPAVLADLAAQGATLPLARQGWPVNGASPNAAA